MNRIRRLWPLRLDRARGPGLGAARLLGAALLLGACEAPPPPPPATPTALPVLAQAFGEGFYEPAARESLFLPEAAAALTWPGQVEPQRYRFLQVLSLRRLADEQRAASVGVALDGWPVRLDVQLERRETGWRIARLVDPGIQRIWLDLLGPDGLPTAPHADPWRGGLAGRDATGRPTAAAVLVAVDQQVWVDGEPLPNDEGRVVEAVRRALTARGALAQRLERAWSPQVVLALPARDAGARHALLTSWAQAAGAEGVALVVRGTQGGPALLPLALRGPRPPGPNPPPVVRIQPAAEGLRFATGAAEETAALDATGAAVEAVVGRLATAKPAPVGGVLEVGVSLDHGRVVALVDAWRAAAPDLPLATRPETLVAPEAP